MRSVKVYVMNVCKSFVQLFWSVILFRMFPRIKEGIADPSYINLSRPIFERVSDRVVGRMINEGITSKAFYVDDFFDCVEFARCFCNYFVQEMVHKGYGVYGKGCPVGVLVFVLRGGGGHACVVVEIDGEVEYYEPYPEHFRRLDLNREEIASMRPVVF